MSARTVLRLLAAAAALALVVVAGEASFSGSATTSGPVYVVQPGDSLWRIAQIDGLSVAQLASANGLSTNAWLQPGMVLHIPPQSYAPGSGATGSPGSAPATSSTPTASGYTTASSSSSSGGSEAVPSGSFCATFSPAGVGPTGVLPALLAESPDRLALRPYFTEWADYYGISPALLEAIAWQESGWQEGVVSAAAAVGVGQIIPSTARFIDNDLVGMNLDPTSVSDNIRMSAAFLGYLNHVEGGNLCNIIAAYYEGPQNLAAYGVFSMTEPYVEDVEALLPRFE